MNQADRIAIVTDTAAGLPAALIERYRLNLVHFWVEVGGHSYLDGVDLTPDAFFDLLRHQPPGTLSTSVPSIETFAHLYRKLAEKAEAILSIHLTEKNSATCNVARLAAEAVSVPVHVINTRTTAMGEGFVVLEAARSLARGLPLDAVIARARHVAEEAGALALLSDIAYAVRGGRVASAARLLGSLLRIHALVAIEDDRLVIAGQARSRKAALNRAIEKVQKRWGDRPVRLAVHYATDRAESANLLERLKSALNCVESYLLRVPPPLGVHAGPDAIGIAYAPVLPE